MGGERSFRSCSLGEHEMKPTRLESCRQTSDCKSLDKCRLSPSNRKNYRKFTWSEYGLLFEEELLWTRMESGEWRGCGHRAEDFLLSRDLERRVCKWDEVGDLPRATGYGYDEHIRSNVRKSVCTVRQGGQLRHDVWRHSESRSIRTAATGNFITSHPSPTWTRARARRTHVADAAYFKRRAPASRIWRRPGLKGKRGSALAHMKRNGRAEWGNFLRPSCRGCLSRDITYLEQTTSTTLSCGSLADDWTATTPAPYITSSPPAPPSQSPPFPTLLPGVRACRKHLRRWRGWIGPGTTLAAH